MIEMTKQKKSKERHGEDPEVPTGLRTIQRQKPSSPPLICWQDARSPEWKWCQRCAFSNTSLNIYDPTRSYYNRSSINVIHHADTAGSACLAPPCRVSSLLVAGRTGGLRRHDDLVETIEAPRNAQITWVRLGWRSRTIITSRGEMIQECLVKAAQANSQSALDSRGKATR